MDSKYAKFIIDRIFSTGSVYTAASHVDVVIANVTTNLLTANWLEIWGDGT